MLRGNIREGGLTDTAERAQHDKGDFAGDEPRADGEDTEGGDAADKRELCRSRSATNAGPEARSCRAKKIWTHSGCRRR